MPNSIKNIKNIFFDLDHTLWDFEKNSALAFKLIFEKHLPEISLENFLSHYIPLNYFYWEKFRNDEISQEQLRYKRLKDSFDALNYVMSDDAIHFISDAYIMHLPTFNHLFDDTLEILDYLSSKYRLHIITNGFHQVQHLKISNANIGHYFVTITNSETAGVKKPNPLIFEHALRRANAERADSIMIGDCIDADVRGAMSCGIGAILFNQKLCGDPNIKQITKLIDLKAIL